MLKYYSFSFFNLTPTYTNRWVLSSQSKKWYFYLNFNFLKIKSLIIFLHFIFTPLCLNLSLAVKLSLVEFYNYFHFFWLTNLLYFN